MSIADDLFYEKGERDDLKYIYCRNGLKLGAVLVLDQKNVAMPAPADTAENIIYQVTVPGGLMGKSDSLRVTMLGSGSGAGNKTWRVAFGSYSVFSAAAATPGVRLTAQVCNRGELARQTGVLLNSFGFGTSGNALTEGAVDTSQDQTLRITCQKATGAEAAAIECVMVELMRGTE